MIKSNLNLKGRWKVECIRDGKVIWVDEFDNLIVDEGKNHALDVTLGGGGQNGTWYVGIFAGDYTPLSTDAGANFSTDSSEFVDYDEPTRPVWNHAGAASQTITNSASKADFTISTGVTNETIYGMFLVSINTIGADGGTLFSAARFSTSRTVNEADTLQVSYAVNAP